MPQFPSAPPLLVPSLLIIHHSQFLGQGNGKTGGWVYFVMVSLLQLFLASYCCSGWNPLTGGPPAVSPLSLLGWLFAPALAECLFAHPVLRNLFAPTLSKCLLLFFHVSFPFFGGGRGTTCTLVGTVWYVMVGPFLSSWDWLRKAFEPVQHRLPQTPRLNPNADWTCTVQGINSRKSVKVRLRTSTRHYGETFFCILLALHLWMKSRGH